MKYTTIKKIHESNYFGIFVEIGLGAPVYTELCKVPGASNTVFHMESAYNDGYSRKIYGIEGRIVSLKGVHTILNSDRIKEISSNDSKINLVFVSSFQIGNYNDKSTHGYVGISYNGKVRYYHISIHDNYARNEYIEHIADNCIRLLACKSESLDIDGVWDENMNPLFVETFNYVNDSENQFTYVKNKNLLRLEDLLRESSDGLILYKGSFNPITKAHIELMKEAKKLHPKFTPCFSISLNNFDKETPKSDQVGERVKLINELGYGVLICQSPLFDNIHINLLTKYKQPIVYLMGSDTAFRYLENKPNLELSNRQFIVAKRNHEVIDISKWKDSQVEHLNIRLEISSTEVRNAIKDKSLDRIRHMIPDEIFENLQNNLYFT